MKSPIQIKNSQIVITKTFAKNAYCFGTPEYEMLQTVRRDYPSFPVVQREIKKNTKVDHYKGLNYEYMKWYIGQYETQEKKELMLKALDEMIDISKCHGMAYRYPTIKKWFLAKYPEVAKFGLVDAEAQNNSKKEEQFEESKSQNVIPMNPVSQAPEQIGA